MSNETIRDRLADRESLAVRRYATKGSAPLFSLYLQRPATVEKTWENVDVDVDVDDAALSLRRGHSWPGKNIRSRVPLFFTSPERPFSFDYQERVLREPRRRSTPTPAALLLLLLRPAIIRHTQRNRYAVSLRFSKIKIDIYTYIYHMYIICVRKKNLEARGESIFRRRDRGGVERRFISFFSYGSLWEITRKASPDDDMVASRGRRRGELGLSCS